MSQGLRAGVIRGDRASRKVVRLFEGDQQLRRRSPRPVLDSTQRAARWTVAVDRFDAFAYVV